MFNVTRLLQLQRSINFMTTMTTDKFDRLNAMEWDMRDPKMVALMLSLQQFAKANTELLEKIEVLELEQ